MAADPALLATCWTHAGDVYPLDDDQRSPFPLEHRIEAVAAAGYTGIGLLHADLAEARGRPGGFGRLRALLERHGIRHVEVEWLDGWCLTGPARAASDARQAWLLPAAQQLGAHHVKVGLPLDGPIVDWDTLVKEFGKLCEHAARLNILIAFEPLPTGPNAMTPAGALQLISQAGHRAGKLCLDAWHVLHGCGSLGQVAALPAGSIAAVELCDAGEVTGTLVEDMLNRRRLPGEGQLNVTGFIQAVMATGYKGPWGIEIISETWRRLSLQAQVTRSFNALRAALDRAAELDRASPGTPATADNALTRGWTR